MIAQDVKVVLVLERFLHLTGAGAYIFPNSKEVCLTLAPQVFCPLPKTVNVSSMLKDPN